MQALTAPYHLWHCVSARSLRVLWLLEELQQPYQLHMLPFPPRALQRSFLERNPLGTVPYFEHGAASMTESAGICEYLAARHPEAGLSVAAGDPGYAAYLNWLHMSDATLTFPQTLTLRYRHFEPVQRQQPQVAEDYQRWFLARLRTLEPALSGQAWLVGQRFTAADVAVGYALLLSEHLGMGELWGAATQAYWQRLQARPALQAALQAEQLAALAQGVDPTPAPLLRP